MKKIIPILLFLVILIGVAFYVYFNTDIFKTPQQAFKEKLGYLVDEISLFKDPNHDKIIEILKSKNRKVIIEDIDFNKMIKKFGNPEIDLELDLRANLSLETDAKNNFEIILTALNDDGSENSKFICKKDSKNLGFILTDFNEKYFGISADNSAEYLDSYINNDEDIEKQINSYIDLIKKYTKKGIEELINNGEFEINRDIHTESFGTLYDVNQYVFNISADKIKEIEKNLIEQIKSDESAKEITKTLTLSESKITKPLKIILNVHNKKVISAYCQYDKVNLKLSSFSDDKTAKLKIELEGDNKENDYIELEKTFENNLLKIRTNLEKTETKMVSKEIENGVQCAFNILNTNVNIKLISTGNSTLKEMEEFENIEQNIDIYERLFTKILTSSEDNKIMNFLKPLVATAYYNTKEIVDGFNNRELENHSETLNMEKEMLEEEIRQAINSCLDEYKLDKINLGNVNLVDYINVDKIASKVYNFDIKFEDGTTLTATPKNVYDNSTTDKYFIKIIIDSIEENIRSLEIYTEDEYENLEEY